MKITEQQLEIYLQAIPPVIWAWIFTDLKEGDAKRAMKEALFDETDSLRDMTQPWVRNEVNFLISKYPEIRSSAERVATSYYVRNSWCKWLPWNWKHW